MNQEKRLTKEIAEALVWGNSPLDISEYTVVDEDAADILASKLYPPNLASLSAVLVPVLARRWSILDLYRLKSLSVSAAEALGKYRGLIHLNGLESLSDSAAEALGGQVGTLSLNGLASLSSNAAEAFGRRSGWLQLNGVRSLSDATANFLGKFVGRLELNGITSLSDDSAKSLARSKGELSLNGLNAISDIAAEALATHEGTKPYVPYGYQLPPNYMSEAGKYSGELSLKRLTSLTDAAAKAFANHVGKLNLDGLTSLSDGAIEDLSKHVGELSLRGVTSLSDLAANALANSTAKFSLYGVTTASDHSKTELAKHRGRIGVTNALLADIDNEDAEDELDEDDADEEDIEEESPSCPYCGEESEDCPHLLAVIDRTFLECNGYLSDRFYDFRELISERFMPLLESDAGLEGEQERKWDDSRLGELWDTAACSYSPGDTEVESDGDVLFDFVRQLLEECGADEFRCPENDSSGPGFSSVRYLMFAEEPKGVCDEAIESLRKKLDAAPKPQRKKTKRRRKS